MGAARLAIDILRFVAYPCQSPMFTPDAGVNMGTIGSMTIRVKGRFPYKLQFVRE